MVKKKKVTKRVLVKKKNKPIILTTKKSKPVEFMMTGIKGLDTLFSNGIPTSSSILVEGGPGTGKTIFCLQLAINACKLGKKVLYMSFEEPEEKLYKHMDSFGWNPKEYEKKGLLKVKRFNSLDIARSVEALLSEAKKELLIEIQPVFFPPGFKADIVCIDSLTSIASAFSGEESRFRVYMEQLFRYLEKEKITSFLIREVSNPSHTGAVYVEKGEAVSFLSDGIIVFYNVIYENGKRDLALEVLKMRGEEFKRRIIKSEIKPKKGLIVYPDKILSKKDGYSLT